MKSLLGAVALIALLGGGCSTDHEAAPSSTSTVTVDPAAFDEHARTVCPAQVESHRVLEGRLVAAYDTTMWDASAALTTNVDPGFMAKSQRDDPTVVCWYVDVIDDPRDKIAPPSSSTLAAIYREDGHLFGVLPQEGPPARPPTAPQR
jgi:hypothetical protein